jgi:ABC-type Fe3+/spermidine/putrescine transport system ATPase subunit
MSRLTVEDLHFARGGKPILAGVSFAHEPGTVLTLLGPSGSGKTTLLWLLAGLLRPDRGRVDVNGDARFGFVFQDGGLWEHLSARGHIDLVLRGRGLARRERAARAARVLGEMGLANLSHRRPGELSGGERQRLALARALAVEPQWLLLDEPTSQLDGPSRDAVVDLLAATLRRTRAGVIVATHQVDLAMRLSDRLAALLDGAIAQIGTPGDLYERPASLAVARLLGPAFELRVGNGTRILRPHQATFTPDAAGAFVVRSCHLAGVRWHVEAMDGATAAVVASDHHVATGTQGRIDLRN